MTPTDELILFGPGLVGQTFIKQWLEKKQTDGLSTRIVGIADSKAFVAQPMGFSVAALNTIIEMKKNHQSLAEHPDAKPLTAAENAFGPQTILIDTTASDSLYQLLLRGLAAGCRIVMANKKNLTQPWQNSEAFFKSARVRFEATVCAGVPVMSSIRRTMSTTDQITAISGSLSGTLGYLCSQFDAGVNYSSAVRTAHQLGYTEPDPRDDLGGLDVARKALILARSCGWQLEMEQIPIEPLFTPELAALSPSDFLSQCEQLDDEYSQKCQQARAEGKVLRYLATVTPQGGSTQLTAVEKQSDFGSLKGAGNKVVIESRINGENPFVISGSGAGAEITASGILADTMELIQLYSEKTHEQ
jgi:homoserine dehydrogenase